MDGDFVPHFVPVGAPFGGFGGFGGVMGLAAGVVLDRLERRVGARDNMWQTRAGNAG